MSDLNHNCITIFKSFLIAVLLTIFLSIFDIIFSGMSVEAWYEQALNCKPITESAVRTLCNMVKGIMAEESNIVSIDSPVQVAGDIHGQFYDVKNLLSLGGGVPANKFIMIGDFVDRGYNSV